MNINPIQFANLVDQRTRAEIELLAAIADRPIPSFRILTVLGVTVDWFIHPDEDDDRAVIFLALDMASAEWQLQPQTKEDTMGLCVGALAAIGCFDEEDRSRFVTGRSKWGRRALAALLCRVPFDEHLIRVCVKRLSEINADFREWRKAC